uniref:Uncharacterized protein n=1 Tax=mine drainage metagenome TaxID=410659 RepID=E6PNI9_9ZZZZ
MPVNLQNDPMLANLSARVCCVVHNSIKSFLINSL